MKRRAKLTPLLVVETVARIRREFFVKGKSIKEIVRDLGVAKHGQEGAAVRRHGVLV